MPHCGPLQVYISKEQASGPNCRIPSTVTVGKEVRSSGTSENRKWHRSSLSQMEPLMREKCFDWYWSHHLSRVRVTLSAYLFISSLKPSDNTLGDITQTNYKNTYSSIHLLAMWFDIIRILVRSVLLFEHLLHYGLCRTRPGGVKPTSPQCDSLVKHGV